MKIATHEDFEDVLKMSLNFLEASPYKDLGDIDTISTILIEVMNGPATDRILLFEKDVGFIIGAVTPFLFGPHRLATEIAWWVEPDHRGGGEGLKLLQAFEYWAKSVADAKLISMSSLNKTVEKYYKKNGYKLYERAYMKVL